MNQELAVISGLKKTMLVQKESSRQTGGLRAGYGSIQSELVNPIFAA